MAGISERRPDVSGSGGRRYQSSARTISPGETGPDAAAGMGAGKKVEGDQGLAGMASSGSGRSWRHGASIGPGIEMKLRVPSRSRSPAGSLLVECRVYIVL